MSRLDHYPAELKYTIQELEYLIVSSGLITHHDIEKKIWKNKAKVVRSNHQMLEVL